jgi:hypothetical protein
MIQPLVMKITPEVAASFLARDQEQSKKNRTIRPSKVQSFLAAIRDGNFKLTHQGIAIAPNGRILDGQHRLLAIIESGETVSMIVAFDTPEETFQFIDRGTPRRVRDALNVPSNIADPCAFIARMHDRTRVEPVDVQEVLDACGPALRAMAEIAPTNVRGLTKAPNRAAVALRYKQTQNPYVLHQWRAFTVLDFDNMSATVKAYYRQIASSTAPKADIKYSYEQAARAWIAFDPSKPDSSKIQVSSIEKNIDEMRAVWQPAWTLA